MTYNIFTSSFIDYFLALKGMDPIKTTVFMVGVSNHILETTSRETLNIKI